MQVRTLFEDELTRRGHAWTIDVASGKHCIELNGRQLLVSLANLERDLVASGDLAKIERFVESILKPHAAVAGKPSAEGLYWVLEPNDYAESAAFRVPVSKRVDRVLAHLSSDGKLISWATHELLQSLGLTDHQADIAAFNNLARALSESTIETMQIDDVALGMISTQLPFKSSLILAPNLKEVMQDRLGWDLLAVTPDRDFVYVWAARHTDFIDRVGAVVVREFSQAPYPISTEIFALSDQGIRAIGAFSP